MTSTERKAFLFLAALAVAITVSFVPLADLVRNGRPRDYYTHIPIVFLISAYILFRRRKHLYSGEHGSLIWGSAVMALGVGLIVFDRLSRPGLIGHAELCASGAIFFWPDPFWRSLEKKLFREHCFRSFSLFS